MVDVSSTESLPQLSDVLHALSDSQQLLLMKVRALREEGEPRRVHNASLQADVAQERDGRNPGPESVRRVNVTPHTVQPRRPEAPPDRDLTPEFEAETAGLSSPAVMKAAEVAPERDSKDRNYNFFDELDAKLARMDGLGGG